MSINFLLPLTHSIEAESDFNLCSREASLDVLELKAFVILTQMPCMDKSR